jgi:branched-chain amino acid transport system ATP-binding protein
MLKIENISKKFGSIQALNGISLSLNAGEAVGIMGINGAGKSTLLNCICGFARPDEGRIKLGTDYIEGLRPDRVSRKGIGRTFQIPRSFRGLTVLENLLLIPSNGQSSDDRTDAALHALRKVKLDRLASNYAGELSGGQQKLLELARVMLINPPVVLLDEPFAGMHSDFCRLFLDEIENMLKRSVSVLMVCHDPGAIYRLSNHIVVMHEGTILSAGSADEIKADPAVIDAYLGTSH